MCGSVGTLFAPPVPLARASGAMRTSLDDSQDDAGTQSQGDLDFPVSLQYEGSETALLVIGHGITVQSVDARTSEPGNHVPRFFAHTLDCNGETALRVTTSAPFDEGPAGSVGTLITTSSGLRSADMSDWPDCPTLGSSAHTLDHIGETVSRATDPFQESTTVQAAHRVSAPFEEGSTVPAGTQAETRSGRRSADKSVPLVLRSLARVRERSGEAAPCVTTPVPSLGFPVPWISDHTLECTGEAASLGFLFRSAQAPPTLMRLWTQ